MELKSLSFTTKTLQSIDNEQIRSTLNHLEILSYLLASVRSFAKYLNSS
jgi:hypothetical protein